MKVIRVFPRRTKATPVDDLVRVGLPELWDEADEIHISVTFTWDLPAIEILEREWRYVAPTKVGGPATGMPGGDFVPGMYLKLGYVITSRGCPNRCWFCPVWKREGDIKTLPITEGWNVQDDNLLACPDDHIRAVFAMLARQKHRIEFTGGLEARRLTEWQARELMKLKSQSIFFAYDEEKDREPLIRAGQMMIDAGFTRQSHILRCYVLCGYKGDSIESAEHRMLEVLEAGFTPMAMLWRSESGERDQNWARFQRKWARPAIIHSPIASI